MVAVIVVLVGRQAHWKFSYRIGSETGMCNVFMIVQYFVDNHKREMKAQVGNADA